MYYEIPADFDDVRAINDRYVNTSPASRERKTFSFAATFSATAHPYLGLHVLEWRPVA
jgi:hypothetical protein